MKALVWRRESSFSLLLFVLFFEKSQLVNTTWTTRPNKSRRRWLRLAAKTGKRLQRDGRCPRFSNADAFSIWAHFHAMQRPLLGILLVGWTFVFVVGFQMDGHLRARQPDSQAGTQAVSIHLRLAGQMDAMLLGPEWKSELCEEVFFFVSNSKSKLSSGIHCSLSSICIASRAQDNWGRYGRGWCKRTVIRPIPKRGSSQGIQWHKYSFSFSSIGIYLYEL